MTGTDPWKKLRMEDGRWRIEGGAMLVGVDVFFMFTKLLSGR